ncbi:tape measure protein [Gemella haemolysans]|uniref:tape measure protein n=1 Tax=Gemella haemolysans TaxID=1379 RepID=UPI00195F12AA|nr:tape measure protein [Gemella haemolysans]VTX71917.1 tape_meas_nterm: tape measure domain protein [Gemella haemolysans]
MAEQYSVEAILSAVDKGFTHTLDAINEKLDKFDAKASKSEQSGQKIGGTFKAMALANLAAGAITKVTGDIGSLISESFKASDAMDKFRSTMQFAGLDNSAIEKSAASVRKYADDTVYDLDTIANTTAQLAANGIKDYDGLTQAAGNLNAVAGGNADTFKSVAMVMTQTASAGKLTGENWRQLSDAIPGASGKIQEALRQNGAYTGDFRKALEQGKISADEFNKAIMDLGMTDVAREAATSTKTIEGAVGNMQAGIVTKINEIIDAIGKDKITGIISGIGELVTGGLDVLKTVVPPVASAISGLVSVISTLAPVLIGAGAALATLHFASVISGAGGFVAWITKIVTGTKLWTMAQAALNLVMKANPIALIIAGVVALVAIVLYLWKTNEGFRNAVIAIWNAIKQVFITAWEAIKTAWSACGTFFSTLWEGLKTGVQTVVQWIVDKWNSAVALLQAVWNIISFAATFAWNYIVGAISAVVQPFIDTFISSWETLKAGLTAVWEGVKMVIQGAWEFIKAIVMGAALIVIDIVTGNFTKLKEDLQMIWDAIKSAVQMVWEGIKFVITAIVGVTVALIKNAWEGLKTALEAIWNFLKTTASTIWNAIKTTVTTLVTGLVNGIKALWEGFKSFFTTLINTVKSVAVNTWNSIKSSVTSIIQSLVNAAQNAWNNFKNGVQSLVNSVKNIFNTLRNINLWDIGRAIMNGLLNGLKSAWESVKGFVSGIAGWIRDHKGPIEYDRRLLIPAGNAIMGGLNRGLDNGFDKTMAKVQSITGAIESRFNINQSKALNVENTISSQPMVITFKLGNKDFRAFVSDINQVNGEAVQLEEVYSI